MDMRCDTAGECSEAEKLPVNVDGDLSVYMDIEPSTGVNDEQLLVKDCSHESTIEVINSSALSASQSSHQQHSSRETESSDINSNGARFNGQHTSSTVVNNHGNCEQFPVDISIPEATVSHCHKNSDGSHRKLHTKSESAKSASVSAESRVGKSSSSTVGQFPIELLPKPTYTLLPISSLLVVVNAQSSGSRTQLPTIAPWPADTVCTAACLPTVSRDGSSVAGDCDGLHSVVLPHKKQQNSVTTVVTQTSSLPAYTACKTAAAATQTSERFAPASRLSKESRASQVLHDVW